MNDREKETVEELKKQLRLAINIDDVTTMIRNDDAEAILNLIEKLQKENEELRAKWDKDTHILQNKLDYANADRIDLTQQNKELRKENEECKLDVQDYLKQAQENAEMYRKAQKKIQDLKAENEELKNNTRKNENELEFDIDCDWIALQKMLDESEKSNEYISYKNEKWIKEKYCIPIQKIKAKIEELDIAISECIYLDEDDEKYKKAVEKDKLCLLNQKRALQELLEEGDLE